MLSIDESIFAVIKPVGMTSHDVVNILRKKSGISRIGHAGTLDPLAEGVLVVGIGREATKKLGRIVVKEKEYLATIELGVTSSTDDEEGNKTKVLSDCLPSRESVEKATRQWIGNVKQVPPIFSAVKVGGKASYARARKGKPVMLSPRDVVISNIEILNFAWPLLELRVVTGPGVYIRSLARDIGKDLSVGGCLKRLVRTRVGEYTLSTASNLEDVTFVKN